MNHGILSTAFAAFAWGGLAEACRPAADPVLAKELDGMITSVEAAMLTLDELDPTRFDRADSLYLRYGDALESRFRDTLDRARATLLGNHYLVLRAARSMGSDQRLVQEQLAASVLRLRALRKDLEQGALGAKEAGTILAGERELAQQLDSNVHRGISNYRAVQRVWDERPLVEPLLAAGQTMNQTRP